MNEAINQRKLGILFALDEERRGLDRVLTGSRVPSFFEDGITTYLTRGAEVLLLVSGVGQECARRAAHRLLNVGANLVLCAGFCAALDPTAGVGDVLVANHVLLSGSDEESIECSPSIRALLPPSQAFGFSIRLCDLVTGDKILFLPREKAELFGRTHAAMYDMETHAAAQVCFDRGVQFAAIRVVSDTAEQRVPGVVSDLIHARSGFVRPILVALRPRSWLALIRLRRQASIAADHLSDVLGTMLVRLS